MRIFIAGFLGFLTITSVAQAQDCEVMPIAGNDGRVNNVTMCVGSDGVWRQSQFPSLPLIKQVDASTHKSALVSPLKVSDDKYGKWAQKEFCHNGERWEDYHLIMDFQKEYSVLFFKNVDQNPTMPSGKMKILFSENGDKIIGKPLGWIEGGNDKLLGDIYLKFKRNLDNGSAKQKSINGLLPNPSIQEVFYHLKNVCSPSGNYEGYEKFLKYHDFNTMLEKREAYRIAQEKEFNYQKNFKYILQCSKPEEDKISNTSECFKTDYNRCEDIYKNVPTSCGLGCTNSVITRREFSHTQCGLRQRVMIESCKKYVVDVRNACRIKLGF